MSTFALSGNAKEIETQCVRSSKETITKFLLDKKSFDRAARGARHAWHISGATASYPPLAHTDPITDTTAFHYFLRFDFTRFAVVRQALAENFVHLQVLIQWAKCIWRWR